MTPEEFSKTVTYEAADPYYPPDIRDACIVESKAFKSHDPMEDPKALQKIAEHGLLLLQYLGEGEAAVPNGVIELLPLDKIADFDMERILGKDAAQKSPLAVAQKNMVRVFPRILDYAEFRDIIFCNGIGVVEKQKGYGTLLYREALRHPLISRMTVAGFVDIAKPDASGELQLIPNDASYALRLNRLQSMVIGVINPPVIDDSITALAVIRPPYGVPFADVRSETVKFEGDAHAALNEVRGLTASGYVGIKYDAKTHEMTFLRLMRPPGS